MSRSGVCWYSYYIVMGAPKANLPTDDRSLIARVSRGDESAFRVFYSRHARYVAGTVYRLLGRDDEVDDVVQDTFLKALGAIQGLQEPERVRSWLCTIAVRCVYQRLHRRRRRRSLRQAIHQQSSVLANARDDALTSELYEALEQIAPKLRVPWILRHLEEHTLAEVAALCGISVATTKRRLSKAKSWLQRRLDHE